MRAQLVADGGPDVLAVKGDAVDLVDAGKRAVFAEDLGMLMFHVRMDGCILVNRQRGRE